MEPLISTADIRARVLPPFSTRGVSGADTEQLADRLRELRLDQLRSELERKGRERLGERVRFLGWVGDLEGLYASLDVVVLTSLNEGTPVALIEAGAAARPVVATRVGGVPDVVSDGVTGALVPPGSPQETAEQIVRLIEHPEVSARFGEAARRTIADRFGGAEPAAYLADLYRKLLAR